MIPHDGKLIAEELVSVTVVHYIVIVIITAFACSVQTANTLTLECYGVGVLWRWSVMTLECYDVGVLWRWSVMALECYGVEVLLQKQLAPAASSVHPAASSVHPATSSVHWSVLIQTFLQCNSFLLLHTYHLSLIIPT